MVPHPADLPQFSRISHPKTSASIINCLFYVFVSTLYSIPSPALSLSLAVHIFHRLLNSQLPRLEMPNLIPTSFSTRSPPSFLTLLQALKFVYPVSPSFLASNSFKLVNPRAHIIATDTVSLRIPAAAVKGLSDEVVLARFTKGFFGGRVFRTESWFMWLGGWRILPIGFSTWIKTTHERIIWNQAEIPSNKFLNLGDILFNAFKVIDIHVKTELKGELPSHIDFGFGSDTYGFGGTHRFTVDRNPDGQALKEVREEGREAEVEIRLECFRCNPVKNQDSWAEWIPTVHRWYAKWLFAEGVRSIWRA